ncbi:MAG: hypothetical protein ACEQSE_15040, partial [Candidatus Aquirickettsiella gammari]
MFPETIASLSGGVTQTTISTTVASGEQQCIEYVGVYNPNALSNTITIHFKDATSSYNICRATL